MQLIILKRKVEGEREFRVTGEGELRDRQGRTWTPTSEGVTSKNFRMGY